MPILGRGIGSASGCALLEGATAFVGFDSCKEPYTNYWLCDGTADQVQINQAIAYIGGLGGGTIMLEAGTFTLTARITIDQANILFRGMGQEATVITTATDNIETIYVTGVDFVVISDMTIQNAVVGGLSNTHSVEFLNSDNCKLINVYVFQSTENGVQATTSDNLLIKDCLIVDTGYQGTATKGAGISILNCNDVKVLDNKILNPSGSCIIVATGGATTSDNILIQGNLCAESYKDNGIYISVDGGDLTNLEITDNIVRDCIDEGGGGGGDMVTVRGSADIYDVMITENIIYNGKLGIYFYHCHNMTISDNIINDMTVGGSGRGIIDDIWGVNTSSDVKICDNILQDIDAGNPVIGIKNTDEALISNNLIEGTGGYGIQISSDNCLISENQIKAGSTSGIDIIAGATSNTIKENKFVGVATPIVDAGTTTILPSKPFQFIKELNGSYETTSPTGILIDAATETAILQGHIPVDAQQIVRLRIFAVAKGAPIGAGGQMHAEFTFNAGAANAAYNTAGKSWNITDFDGEEADYVANDVVTWVIEDGDVGNELSVLVASDKFELFAIYETGADPDGATNAVFGSISIEYV